MLYGEEIVSESQEPENPSNSTAERILAKTKELTEKDIHWHYRILFPDCIFNKHKGKWNIVFEDVTSKVAEGKGIPINDVLAAAKGRGWTGEEAFELGFVDELGELETALELAKEAAGIFCKEISQFKTIPKRKKYS